MQDKKEKMSKEEIQAMKEYMEEIRSGGTKGEDVVLKKINEMPEPDMSMARKIHDIVKKNTPGLVPRLWYGMPAYENKGKVVCFFQPASKFKTRYATLGFTDKANLDEGNMWPTSFALVSITKDEEKRIAFLVKKSVG